MQRLPLHRSLSESQTMLVNLTQHWQLWLNHAADQGGLSSACRQSTRLEAWQISSSDKTASKYSQTKKASLGHGKLIISCDNATNATQIKQRQQSLLEFLNKSLAQNNPSSPLISTVVVRLRYDDTQLNLSDQKSRDSRAAQASAALMPIAETSIRAIEVCQKTVSNEDLAKSLQQLAATLRSLS